MDSNKTDISMVPSAIVLRRIRDGVVNHFPIRVSEWIMIYPTIGMGIALKTQPDMFNTSPSFASIASWADEITLAAIVLACAAIRLVALIVNGTFQGFGISPHLRLFAAVVGLIFWSQFTFGFLDAALFKGGAWSGVIAYSTLMIIEMTNAFRSWVDVLRYHDK